MTETDKPKEDPAKDFKEAQETILDITRYLENQANHGDRKKVDEAEKKLKSIVYNCPSLKGRPELAGVPNADALPYELAASLAKGIGLNHYAELANSKLSEKGNLEKILATADDKKLEGILKNEKIAQLIADKAGKDYYDWFEQYKAYISAKNISEFAEKGKLPKEVKQAVLEQVAESYAQEQFDNLADSSERARRFFAECAKICVMNGLAGEDVIKKQTKKMAKEAEDKLKAYETEKRVNIRTYFGAAIDKMLKGDAEEENMARELVYKSL